MILRRDHIAGFAFVTAGALIYVFSGDLPWGSLAMPGAGMMPKLVLGLMIIFGLVLLARGSTSPPLSEIDWSDRSHALCLIVAAALATALYTTLGFVLTMSLLLFRPHRRGRTQAAHPRVRVQRRHCAGCVPPVQFFP